MADELILYTNPMSRGRIARWMLEEVGQPYRTEVLDYASSMKAPAYLAINPMGKVPALRHGDMVGDRDCRHLRLSGRRLSARPSSRRRPGDRRRGPYYRWLFFTAGPVEAAVSNKALGFVVPQERERMIGYGRHRARHGCARSRLYRGPTIWPATTSPPPTSMSAPQLGFGMMFGTIEKRPAFERYWQRISIRPACKRAKELDDALAPRPAAKG